jgi:hypothetical protein
MYISSMPNTFLAHLEEKTSGAASADFYFFCIPDVRKRTLGDILLKIKM